MGSGYQGKVKREKMELHLEAGQWTLKKSPNQKTNG
jgi:hypothetical protein